MSTTIAIIGSGFGMYCLLPAFSKIKKCKVVGISGKNSTRMDDFCKKFNVKQYTNWKTMLENEKPDAVAIAVIPKYQFEIVKYALEKKISIFAEKPLTMRYDDSLELTKLAQKYNIPNMVDFEFPEIPEWHEVKQILDENTLGKISSIDVNWTFMSYDLLHKIKSWKTDVKQGGGALSLVLSHTFYYLEFFLGKIQSMEFSSSSSDKSLNNGDTTINMSLLFENGCIGNVHVDISNTNKPNHTLKFVGNHGILTLENNTSSFVDHFEIKFNQNNNLKKISPRKTTILPHESSEDQRVKIVNILATKFIKWCESNIPQKPDFQDGLRVQELIQMARNSNIEKF